MNLKFNEDELFEARRFGIDMVEEDEIYDRVEKRLSLEHEERVSAKAAAKAKADDERRAVEEREREKEAGE